MSFQDVEFRSPLRASLDLRGKRGARGLPAASASAAHVIRFIRSRRSQRAAWALVGMLLMFALAHLLVRGPIDVKGNTNLCDYANHYSAARVWLIGGNPYDNAALPLVWQASWPGPLEPPLDQWWGLLPPGAFVLLAPIGALPAWAATALWLALSLGAVAACIIVALNLANIRINTLPAWLLIGGALAAAPFQTLIAVGQVSLFAIALILLAILCSQRGRDAWAGVLLALAGSMKPQLAAPFAIFYLLYRNWTIVKFGAVTGLVVNLIGIAQLEWHGHAWWTSWTANLAASTAPGSANDPTLTGPWRHQIVNLTVLLHSFVASKTAVTVIGATVSAALIGCYVWFVRRAKFSSDSLLSLGILCVLALLPVYHRSYDAALLIIPLAWALTSLRGPLKNAAWLTLAAMSVFLVPFDALVVTETKLGWFRGISQTWAWNALVAPHHAWAALATCACLIGALALRVRQLGAVYDTDQQPDVIRLHAYQRADETAQRWRGARTADMRRERRTG